MFDKNRNRKRRNTTGFMNHQNKAILISLIGLSLILIKGGTFDKTSLFFILLGYVGMLRTDFYFRESGYQTSLVKASMTSYRIIYSLAAITAPIMESDKFIISPTVIAICIFSYLLFYVSKKINGIHCWINIGNL